MKKHVLAFFGLCAVAFASPVMAQTVENPWYLGIGYTHTMLTYENNLDDSFADSFPGGEAFIGYQFHDFGAIEVGGYVTLEEEQNGPVFDSSFQMMGGYISLVGIMPVHDNLSLLADIGYMFIYKDITATGFGSTSSVDGTQDGVRAGLGVELFFTQEVGLRAMAHYLQDTSEGIDYQMQYDAALVYHF